ncbi:MAG: glycosyltransferase family 2 protein [Actinomycetota bacterium]|nr:glycosyltransferase family 2 protein [Actinomycetota bacterium]
MSSNQACVFVLGANDRSRSATALENLRSIMGVGDALLAAVEGAAPTWLDALAKRWRAEVVPIAELGTRLAQEAQDRPYTIFVDDHTYLLGKWSQELLARLGEAESVLGHPCVAAPRSPSIVGVQRIILSEGVVLQRRQDLRDFSQKWTEAHRGIWTQERYVSSALFAVSTSTLATQPSGSAVQTWSGIHAAVMRACVPVVAHGSIIYGNQVIETRQDAALQTSRPPATVPYVSVCMIMKNEERFIAQALDSVLELADEVVIFDTGSTDDSIRIARDKGAAVLEGEWRNDFGWARNQALAACRGKWILWIDADEVVEADPSDFRAELRQAEEEYEGLSVRILNEVGSGLETPSTHWAMRAFRRSDGMFSGALHETVWSRLGDRSVYATACTSLQIRHYGYLNSVMTERNKGVRNVEIASKSHSFRFPQEKKVHEARSRMLLGEWDQAAAIALEVARDREGPESFIRLAWRVAIDSLLFAGRVEEAAELLEEAADAPLGPVFLSYLRGELDQARGRHAEALEHYLAIGETYRDGDGWEITTDHLRSKVIQCHESLGNPRAALDLALASLGEGRLDLHLGKLIEWADASGTSLEEVARRLPSQRRELVFAQLLQLDPQTADSFLDAAYAMWGRDMHVLAAASLVARRLDVQRQLAWSLRLRAAGLASACPLAFTANDPAAPEHRRKAAAQALEAGVGTN